MVKTYEGRGCLIDIGAYSLQRDAMFSNSVSDTYKGGGGSSLIDSDSYSHKGTLSCIIVSRIHTQNRYVG